MGTRAINYDRPCIIKLVQSTGMEVFMYKDNPGHYMTIFGTPVPLSIAKAAGYDVDNLERKRLKNQRIAAAAALIEQDYDAADAGIRTLVANGAGFKLVNIGLGRHIVEDPDGNCITPNPLPKEAAFTVFDGMVKQAQDDAALLAGPGAGVGPGLQSKPPARGGKGAVTE